MRKLFARRTLLPATLAMIIAVPFFVVQACTAGDGTSPTCMQDVSGDGHQNLGVDGCNPFAACHAVWNDETSKTVTGEQAVTEACCHEILPDGGKGDQFEGQMLKICLYGYGEKVDLSSSASGGDGSGGAGGGK